jgi:hypothetical protein
MYWCTLHNCRPNECSKLQHSIKDWGDAKTMETQKEQHRERVINLLREISDVRFKIELMSIETDNPELLEVANNMTESMRVIGRQLGD